MGKMKLGEVDAFQRASDMAWSWMMRFPMANNVWANYFEDIPIMAQLTNFNQYAPGETARYLMDHPEKDPEWRAHVKGLVAFIEKTRVGWHSPVRPPRADGCHFLNYLA
jgi:hypothetical protein